MDETLVIRTALNGFIVENLDPNNDYAQTSNKMVFQSMTELLHHITEFYGYRNPSEIMSDKEEKHAAS